MNIFPWDANNFFIKPEKKNGKRYVHIYGCCIREDLGESILAEDFEKVLEKETGFEDFINSYFKYSCYFIEDRICQHVKNFENLNKFVGINNNLLSFCNLNCDFCRWENERPEFTKDDKEYFKNLYYKLLDKWAESDFEYLRLTEYGEPLYFIEDNIKFFEKIKKKKTIAITTNALLLDKYIPIFEKYKDKIDFKVIVSLNAYNEEIYLKKMRTNAFEKVLQNMMLAKDYLIRISFFLYEEEKLPNKNREYNKFIENTLRPCFPNVEFLFLFDLRFEKNRKI